MRTKQLRDFTAAPTRSLAGDDDRLHDAQHAVRFSAARAKLTIATIEPGFDVQVAAQFNPRELQINQTIDWHEHEGLRPDTDTDVLAEFGGMKAPTMQIELFFDGFERRGMIDSSGRDSVMGKITALKQLASPMQPDSKDDDLRRPPYCVVVWGDGADGLKMPKFRCVVESISIKYQAWATDGTVLRATVTVGLRGADPVVRGKDQPAAGKPRAR